MSCQISLAFQTVKMGREVLELMKANKVSDRIVDASDEEE
jgi:hypothetical protein